MNITNDKVTEYINKYYSPLDDELGSLRSLCEEKEIPLILRETEMFLRTLLTWQKPSRILEIGTAFGYSALFFAKYLPDASVTTMERSEYMIENAETVFASHKEAERINFLKGDAGEMLDELQLSDEKFDFVFIDAAKSHYREFFDKAEKLCNSGAVILCDNILMKAYLVDNKAYEPTRRHRTSVKRMQEFIDYLYGRRDLSVSLLSDGDGLALIVLNE